MKPVAAWRDWGGEILAAWQAWLTRASAASAAWTGELRYGPRLAILALAAAVLLITGGRAGGASLLLILWIAPAVFLPLVVGPRRYAVAVALLALSGGAVLPAGQVIALTFVLVGLAGAQLPFVLALPAALAVAAVYAAAALHGLGPPLALQMGAFLLATFAGSVSVRTRRVARARQTAMLAELQQANAELRQAQAQLRLDSERAAALAAAEERERIAREIHDILAHTLTVLVVQTGATKRLVQRDPPRAAAQLDLIAQLARDGLAEVRRSIHALRSADEEGLPALRALVEAFGTRTGVACTFAAADDLPPLPPAASKALYRVLQEALTNAVRHGNATAIVVTLKHDGECLLLTVQDNGVGGAAPPPVVGGGNGLPGAAERLSQLGGTLAAAPAPEGGFRVSAALPRQALQPPIAAAPDAAYTSLAPAAESAGVEERA